MTQKNTSKEDLIRRLKIIEGHLRKITSMVEEDKYCIDIMQQTAAVRSAIKRAEELLLNNHLNSCVIKAIKQDKEKRAIEELVEVFRKSN